MVVAVWAVVVVVKADVGVVVVLDDGLCDFGSREPLALPVQCRTGLLSRAMLGVARPGVQTLA